MRFHFVFPAALALVACSKPLDLGLARSGMRALPAIPASGLTASRTALLADDFMLRQFFSLQCHADEINNCPAGVPVDQSTRYTAQALLGLLYAVDREVGDVFKADSTGCSAGEDAHAITASSSSFLSNDGGEPTRYMLDLFSQVGCVGHQTKPATKYYAYSAAAPPTVLIATRKHDLYSVGMDQTDLYQIYVTRTDTGENRLLAFNDASVESLTGYSERVVLLVNFQTRRFMVQYRQQGTEAFLTAAGKGGLTPSGAYEAGAFWVRTGGTYGKTTPGACIDNATRAQVAASNCEAEQAAWAGAGDAAAYLDATAADQVNLAPFLALFSAGAAARDLPLESAPATAADAVNFPDKIQ